MSRTNSIIGIAVFIIGVVLYSSTFVIREDEQALVLQFGDPRREVKEAGLNFKVPFIQDAVYFDKRVLDFDASAAEVPTLDHQLQDLGFTGTEALARSGLFHATFQRRRQVMFPRYNFRDGLQQL